MNNRLAILRFAPSLGWLVVAGVGVALFVYLAIANNPADDGTPRTVFDRAVPYVFLLLVPYGLWQAFREFRQVHNEAQLTEEFVRKEVERKERMAAAKVRLQAPSLELTAVQKTSISSLLAALRQYSIVGEGEIDDTKFLELCIEKRVETTALYELSGVLDAYAEVHGDLANCLIIYDQVEIHENSITSMVEGFARLAGRSDAIGNLTFDIVDQGVKPVVGEVRFTLDGTPQSIRFDHYNKYASGSLMERLAELFQATDLHFCLAYFDSVYLVSRLTQQQCTALNSYLDIDDETFSSIH